MQTPAFPIAFAPLRRYQTSNYGAASVARYATDTSRQKNKLPNHLLTLTLLIVALLPAVIQAQTYSDGSSRQQELAHVLAILGTRLSQDSEMREEDFDAVWNRLYDIYAHRNLSIRDPDLAAAWERIEDADRNCLQVLASIAKIDNEKPSGMEIFLDSIGSGDSQRQKDDLDRAVAGRILSEIDKYMLEDRFREKEGDLEARISELEALDERLPKVDGESAITVEYLPSWNGVYAADLIRLTNHSGSDLRNVPLLITVVPQNGRPIVHVHYVSQWRNGSTLMTTYPYQHSSYNNAEAVNAPATVEASLYQPTGTTKSFYQLTQSQWDSLVQSYCASLKFKASFLGAYIEEQTNVRQPPGMQFSFDGLSNLPVKRLTVRFWNSENEGTSVYWDVDRKLESATNYDYRSPLFEQGTGALAPGASPTHIQFSLEFAGTNYKEVRSLY